MSEPTNKNIAAEIVPHLYYALRDPYLGRIVFLLDLIQKYTVSSWHRHYYTIMNKIFGLGFIKIFFMTEFLLLFKGHPNPHLWV